MNSLTQNYNVHQLIEEITNEVFHGNIQEDIIMATNSTQFFADYLAHETQIKKYFNSVTKRYYPSRSKAEAEDRLSQLMLDMERLDTFNGWDPERGEFDTYLYAQICNIVGGYYRKAARAAKYLVPNTQVESEEMELAISRTVYDVSEHAVENHEDVIDTQDARMLVEASLLEKEVECLRLIIDEDLSGSSLVDAMGINAMALSRMRKSIKEKLMDVPGLAF
jgi:hypothetical protein